LKNRLLKWDDEPIAITVPEVVAGKNEIVLVIHDPGHGGWQFMDGQEWKGRKPTVIRKVEVATTRSVACRTQGFAGRLAS
jgi:hypothetical protein